MLEATGLACERGERELFRDLAFTVEPGSLLRIGGPNGTGKTSLLRILCGLLAPTAGELRWRGERVSRAAHDYLRELAYVGHLNGVKDDLTALENLRVAARIAALEPDSGSLEARARAALVAVGLERAIDSPARFLSQGQRRRIALARLWLAERCALWVLDEPFAALDARGVEVLAGRISAQLARGHSVIFTTHQEVPIAAASSATLMLGDPAATGEPAC